MDLYRLVPVLIAGAVFCITYPFFCAVYGVPMW